MRPETALFVALSVASVALAGRGLGAADRPSPATLEDGRRLLAENGCDGACHAARVDGADPITLYTRPNRRVQSREDLHKQVESCVSHLGSMIFPEEIDAVAAALDHDHYHFD